MDVHTPADWVFRNAERDPDAPALQFGDGVVTYHQLADEVVRRAHTITGRAIGAVESVRVRHDLSSIVDVLAHQHVGTCVMPYAHDRNAAVDTNPGAVVCFATSGSTGPPRLVPLSMANLRAAVVASRSRLGTGEKDRWLLTLPLHHVGGMSVLWRSFEAGGSAVVTPFGHGIFEAIERSAPTVASWVPTMVHRILDTGAGALDGIRVNLVGGARIGAGLRNRLRAERIAVVPTYGMTEASSQIATHAPGSPDSLDGTAGEPLEGVSVTISEPDERGFGRVAVDGPQVFGGYLGGDPRIGPFISNDLGRLTSSGRLEVLGRVDDIVVTGGENVSLGAVADAVHETGLVSDAAIVGVHDPEWGTAVCAMVATSVDPTDIADRIRASNAPHMVPKRWVKVDAIPLLPNGKHDLNAVRAAFDAK